MLHLRRKRNRRRLPPTHPTPGAILKTMTLYQPINFQQEIQQKLKQRNGHSHTELDKNTFRASSVGYCPRQILLSKLGVKKFDADTQGRFQTGDFIHDWIQENILPQHPTKHENQVTVQLGDITLKGHYDCFDPVNEIVYDFKSRSSWYKYQPPYERHLQQLEVYMRALGVTKGQMVYVSKSDLTVETYPDYFEASNEREDNGEGNQLVTSNDERWNKIVDKVQNVRDYLVENGYPTSVEQVNAAFKPCNNSECMGCKFEDTSKWDFSHVKNQVEKPEIEAQ